MKSKYSELSTIIDSGENTLIQKEMLENLIVSDSPLSVKYIKIMRGPTYFTPDPVIIMRLDLGEFDEVYSNDIPGLYKSLRKKIPTLIEHHCSIGKRGGFFQRVKKGTLLGHIIEHVALELQSLAGMKTAYGKTRSTLEKGIYNVITGYHDDVAGTVALIESYNFISSILLEKSCSVKEIIDKLIEIREKRVLGPSTQSIVDEAVLRGINCLRLDRYNLIQLGSGKYRKIIRATITGDTNLIAVETADNKARTVSMLKDEGVPVPETLEKSEFNNADNLSFFKNKKIVIKPCSGSGGNGVTTGLTPGNELFHKAFVHALNYDKMLLIQEQLPGKTFRLLVIDFSFVAASELTPPSITGDGKSTVEKLINLENRNPKRHRGDKSALSKIPVDEHLFHCLSVQGLTIKSVLEKGKTVKLSFSGNPRKGGKTEDVTEKVHPENIFFAERAARTIDLNVAGINMIAEDISLPLSEQHGGIIDINAAPDFRMHLIPADGQPANVAEPLVNMLFPSDSPVRIPVYSFTGSAGKTTAVRLMSHCLKTQKRTVGMTTNNGLYLGDRCIRTGDMTYSSHVQLVLRDTSVEAAVLETSKEAILRSGLGYRYADFGVVLNTFEEHLGSDDIEFIDELAYTKAVVAEQVYDNGYAVLNADDPIVRKMAERLYSNIIYFSANYTNETMRKHAEEGNVSVALDNSVIVVLDGRDRIEITSFDSIPLTHNGKYYGNLDEILAVTAILFAEKYSREEIAGMLTTFIPDRKNLPGKMNFYSKNEEHIFVDNAHTAPAIKHLREFFERNYKEQVAVLAYIPDDADNKKAVQWAEALSQTSRFIVLYPENKEKPAYSAFKKAMQKHTTPESRIVETNSKKEALERVLNEKNKIKLILSRDTNTNINTVHEFLTKNGFEEEIFSS